MTTKRRYRKVLRKLDESLMEPLPKTGDISRKAQQMYDNLWVQFGLTQEKRKKMLDKFEKEHPGLAHWEKEAKKPCVNEWAWTAEVKAAFYAHPYHKAFVKKLQAMRGMTWGLWVLDSEPADYAGDSQ